MRRALAFLLVAAVVCLFACAPTPAENEAFVSTASDITSSPLPTPSAAPSASLALIDIVLYLPDETGTGLVAIPAQADDSPSGLIAALVSAGALPNVDYGQNITCSVEQEELVYEDLTYIGVFIHLDLSDAFAQAVKQGGTNAERLTLQSLTNTMLTRYGADGLILSIAGTDLETLTKRYNRPIGFDELAQTRQTDPAS